MRDQESWTMESLAEFWRGDNLVNIKPAVGGEFPEGFDPRKVLAHMHLWAGGGAVTELGCGYGRCAPAFRPGLYTGLDINPAAVDKARQCLPDYRFEVVGAPEQLPGGSLLLAYTVFLHMPDDVLLPWVQAAEACYEHILVCEILGRDWRATAGVTPVFNRELEDYKALLAPFELCAEVRLPYQRYVNSEFAGRVRNTDISFMLFCRQGARLSGLAL